MAQPDTALLLVVAKLGSGDGDAGGHDAVAQYALPVSSLRRGFRVLPLEYLNGDPLAGARLLCHVRIIERTLL